MDGQDEVITKELQHSGGQTINIIKGKRTKRQRPQSPIPFRMMCAPYNNNYNNRNNNNNSAAKSDEGSDICSNNQENDSINGVNNVVVDMTTTLGMSTIVSDDEDCHPTTTTTTTTTTTANTTATTTTEEEEDMANCLILLAQGHPYNPPQPQLSFEEDHHQEDHVVNCNIPTKFTSRKFMDAPKSSGGGYYVYECKTCSKTFPSFQALGGHRASHKKPKIKEENDNRSNFRSNYTSAFGSTNFRNNNSMVFSSDEEDPPFNKSSKTHASSSPSLSLQLTNRALYSTGTHQQTTIKPRVHECSICGAEFSSGQALGGHMRRHRGPLTSTPSSAAAGGAGPPLATDTIVDIGPSSTDQLKLSLDLDLNLPAPAEDTVAVDHQQRESQFVFASKQPLSEEQPPPPQPQQSPPRQNQQQQPQQEQQQQIVFSSPALVDCHY